MDGAGQARPCVPVLLGRLGVTAAVDGNRVVLTLRTREAITRLFGLRPDSVGVERRGAEDDWRSPVRVKVQYVSPQIPTPDSAFRAEAARAKRRYLASINWITRGISGGQSGSGAIWIAIGDSSPINVSEMRKRSSPPTVSVSRSVTWVKPSEAGQASPPPSATLLFRRWHPAHDNA